MRTIRLIVMSFVLVITMGTSIFAAEGSVNNYLVECSGGSENKMTAYYSQRNWVNVIESYIYQNDDNTFSVLDASNDIIVVDKYSSTNFELISSQQIETELERFGGFYCGDEFNFIVFGQKNPELQDDVATFRVVKYSKEWQRIDYVDYCDNNTYIPFDAGTLRMDQYNKYLFIRTCHEMYNGHQANVTFSVDTEKMEIVEEFSSVLNIAYGYVSHSFNQFVKVDGNRLYAVDHGDAYPRSVVLGMYDTTIENGKFLGFYNHVDLFKIPGETGANCTGVMVGGFETSLNNCLVAIITIDHSKITSYTPYRMDLLNERDVVLLINNKDNFDSSNVKQVYLTDYIDKDKLASIPCLVKLSNDKFVVLWEEFDSYVIEDEYGTLHKSESKGVKYVYVDGNGNVLSETKYFDKANLSVGCQPIIINNKLVWYVNESNTKRTFYSVDTENVVQKLIGETTYYFETETGTITNVKSSEEQIDIPATIDGINVRNIEANAFSTALSIKSIGIPRGIVMINDEAFKGLSDYKLYVRENSTAHDFAKDNEIDYEIIRYIKGDVYEDENVNSKDAIKLSQYIAKWNMFFSNDEKKASDIIEDGNINSKDIIKLNQYIAKWNVSLE